MEFGLKKSTVGYYSHLHRKCGLVPPAKVKSLQHHSQIIPAKLEVELVSYLKNFTLMNHGLSTSETRQVAYSFAIGNKIQVPNTWVAKEASSDEWMRGFLKRHSSISIRNPKKLAKQEPQALTSKLCRYFTIS